jgi:XTP/dITP diphosphohydrolase
MDIVLASANLHKMREFREMFKKTPTIELLPLSRFASYIPPEETGTTFQENARLKARHAAMALKQWALADDSGLCVPALQGAPGVHSRRYAGKDATDADNRKKLLREMAHLTELERSAYFECCLALCSPTGEEKWVTAKCEGVLLTEERGRHGFGYDALFMKYDYDKTFAELTESVKTRISHRYKAFEKLLLILSTL